MKDFCSGSNEVITQQNYADSYGAMSCLPNNGTGFSQLNSDGIIDSAALDSYVSTLIKNADAIPPAEINTDTNPAAMYATKAAALRESIGNEYCFYYKRYMWALEHVLALAATPGLDTTTASYVTMKENAQNLNMKLNQILQILQGIVKSRAASLDTYYGSSTGVNAMNSQLDKTRDSLMQHMGKLQNSDMETDVKSAMIDYTIEKNSSSRNMLMIYGVMNMVAAGMLFYLYRNTRS